MRETVERAAVFCLWKDERASERFEASPPCQQIVEPILGSGFLAGEQSVEVFEVHGGRVLAGELASNLGR